MKKILVLGLLISLLCGLLAGCLEPDGPYIPTGDALQSDGDSKPSATRPVSPEQPLRLVYDPAASLNPYQSGSATNRVLFPLMYQGLFSLSADYTPVPILCSYYRCSQDMKEYTFYLENATFSDGTVLTAADAVASLNAARNNPVYSGRLKYVSQVSVSADGAVVIQLSTAYDQLPMLLDIPIVKASQVNDPRPLGTGPYVWEEPVTGPQLTLRKDWWCEATLPITATMIPLVEGENAAQIRDLFEYGQLDLVCTDPGSDKYVDFRSDYELWSCENGIFVYLACNEKSPVFSNAKLRRALTHAIDRNELVEVCYRGFATAAMLPASPASPYYSRPLAAKYGYDPDVFAQAVAEYVPAPKEGEEPITVTLLVNKGDSRRVLAARAIAEMLTQLGLSTTTKELSGKDYTNALSKGNYDLHLGQTTLSPNMDLSSFYNVGGSLSFGGLADAAIASMCQEALENVGNYYTLHKMVMEDGVLCPLVFRSYGIYTTRGTLSQLGGARDNLFFYTLGKTMEEIYLA